MTHRHPREPDRGSESAQEPFFVRFAHEYGWRAYAIPVLAVITVCVLANMAANPDDAAVAAPAAETVAVDTGVAGGRGEGSASREPATLPEGDLGLEDLPPGGPFTEDGEGTYREVGVPGTAAGSGDELVLRYAVEVENGLDTSRYGGDDAFATLVDATLADPRGWTNDPRFGFEHVAGNQDPDLRIRLTSPGTTKDNCGGSLGLETSCRTMATGESTVVINEARWVRGASPFQGDLGSYRQYLINHEVGHALGFAEHVACPATGELAPIMMQQTLSLNNAELHSLDHDEVYPDSDETCRANPWPYPRPAVL
ncbi:DUF3152 domain-containing protein [Corynebacterium qintianiae]|uniref:DUF3152 domain-containing protein n=1 Tax=Corynebacterium qintianiae TaxID=2709392 RepID=A0A7T0KP89_9CORY|nr:DUF3152 domain-containing protein [Corynebacterium qintianiae]QPK83719.1 DUF3152 domain-containing protein [Corynebacterium qintianiae]